MTGWRVFASWQGFPDPTFGLYAGPETVTEHPTWAKARHDALQHACMRGVRYVSVQRPDDVVAGEYDRITNHWRQYPHTLVDVDHTTEIVNDETTRHAQAWCTCGWARFVPYSMSAGAAEAAVARAEEKAREHRADPGVW